MRSITPMVAGFDLFPKGRWVDLLSPLPVTERALRRALSKMLADIGNRLDCGKIGLALAFASA